MKAIFVSFNQAHYDDVIELLSRHNQKGYTAWEEVMGCGSDSGLPHLGSHAYPTLNSALLVFTEDDMCGKLLISLQELDKRYENLGLRAFSWAIEATI